MSTFQVNDIGSQLLITVTYNNIALDISTATIKNFILRRPDGVDITVNASFVNTGTDGQLQYLTQNGDLSIPGLWRIQAYIEMTGVKWYSQFTTFTVYPNL